MFPVLDPHEDLFLLYSQRNAVDHNRGLGYLDNHKDVLTISFDEPPLEIQLAQDKTALHSRKGDTGSVLWRASIDFAQVILSQTHSNTPDALFPRDELKQMHVLELGSGVGLLAIALGPLVRRYTATDISQLIPLIQKNISLNLPSTPPPPKPKSRQNAHVKHPQNAKSQSRGAARGKGGDVSKTNDVLAAVAPPNHTHATVTAEELDWEFLASLSPTDRAKNFTFELPDLILAVDCIYHPSLLPSFIETIDYLAVPGKTTVVVVSELRSEDVIREFLELWLAKEEWRVWRVPDLLSVHYAVWYAKKGVEFDDTVRVDGETADA